jgi:hypothetical protein
MFRNGQIQGAVSYTIVSAIAAFCVVCLPVSAENSLTKLNVTSTPLMSVSDVARIQKADRLSGILFEERWNAVPAPSTGTRNEQSQRETPWAETHIEKIPFSCELAFSRLVKTGNFSTRCIATAGTSRKLAAAVPAGLLG